jgi:ornithine cyclodeaminase/alanine dehydrogenase-like protein (mu-crystallin family)
MALLIREREVEELLTFDDAYKALKDAFGLMEHKLSINSKRTRIIFSGSVLTIQAGGILDYLGFKTYVMGNFLGLLFHKSGELLAIVESDRLTRVRTTVLSVLVSDLIKKNYSSVGIIGLGRQGIVQVEAFYELKKLKPKIYTRSKERLNFALKYFNELRIEVDVKDSIKDVCKDSEVIVTITSSKDPFLKLEYLSRGTHINAMGSNIPERVELYPEVIKASKLIIVEDLEQAREEAGDLILASKMNMMDWSKVVLLSSIITGKVNYKISDQDLTIFKSVGIGLEDVAILKLIYEKAKKKGIGMELKVDGRWYPELEEK